MCFGLTLGVKRLTNTLLHSLHYFKFSAEETTSSHSERNKDNGGDGEEEEDLQK